MLVNITGRNIEMSESLKSFVMKKLEKVNLKLDHPLKADLVLSIENKTALVEINTILNHHQVNLSTSHSDMYTAINMLVKKIKRKLNEIKTRN